VELRGSEDEDVEAAEADKGARGSSEAQSRGGGGIKRLSRRNELSVRSTARSSCPLLPWREVSGKEPLTGRYGRGRERVARRASRALSPTLLWPGPWAAWRSAGLGGLGSGAWGRPSRLARGSDRLVRPSLRLRKPALSACPLPALPTLPALGLGLGLGLTLTLTLPALPPPRARMSSCWPSPSLCSNEPRRRRASSGSRASDSDAWRSTDPHSTSCWNRRGESFTE
jgi:hypothetical protein